MLAAVPRRPRSPALSRILVLGGYGGFGGRLSRRLASAGHDVLVAGRDIDRARHFCRGLANCKPFEADRDAPLEPLLAEANAELLIDAAGPFQGSDYRVPEACIAAGVHYLDLADGRDFVAGVGRLDEAARRRGVAIISGASSVPALSGAAVRLLADGMETVTAIEIAISASNQATAGFSVAAAILSYVGKPIRLWRGGRWTHAYGWQDLRRQNFALGESTALADRWTALADVPDLELLPDRVIGRPAVTFRAGTELAYQNFLLWLGSWLVRWKWLGSLRHLAPLLRPLSRLTAGFGSDRSGMAVQLFGIANGRRVERRWTLVADKGEGPEIPTLAAAILAGRAIEAGARDAGPLLTLEDFATSFSAMAITTETSERPQPDPLYAQLMGGRFAALAPEVRAMHMVLRDGGATGRATVSRGTNILAHVISLLMRFPPAGDHELHVAFAERDGIETWTRDFSGNRFSSHLSRQGPYLIERFGPLRFRFDLTNQGNGLRMTMRRWSLLKLPLPLWLAPRSEAREWAAEGRFHFDVPITLPLIGTIVHYRGWLTSVGQIATE